ncbi:MAG: ABC transporter ATP-binding protein/permease, partial [Chloroflexota bacterium]|nr:ABC transporter ATP-binding protein/permease [Chloroflexota bacterium]
MRWVEGGRATARRYRQLLRYAMPYWKRRVLIVTMTLLSIPFSLLQPWPMKIVVDHVLGQAPMSGTLAHIAGLLPGATTPEGLLAWVVVAGLGIFAVNSTVDVILTISWIRVGQAMVYDLARDLFAHIQRRPLLFHSRNSVGDLISRITGDSWCVNTVVDQLIFTPAYALITIVAMAVLMAHMSVGLTLLSLAVAPLLAMSSLLSGRRIRAKAREGRQIQSRIHSHIHQALSSIPVVQMFTREDREQRRFRDYAAEAIRNARRNTLADSLSRLGSGLSTTLGRGVILWLGAYQVLDGTLSIGSLLVFLSYLGSLQGKMKELAGAYSALQGTSASIERVMEMLEVEPEVRDQAGASPLPPARGHVRLEHVTFGYEPGRPVLYNVSLEVRPGQTIAIVGPTGAGKSTLVSLIPRFFDPWEGRVTVDGHDVRDVQLKSLREQVALVLQESFLFPLTIAENIAYGRPDASREEIAAAARAANAHIFIERLPQGYDTIVGERGATLSGGERQRLAIARALLKDAPILILDEPTSALDAETEGLLLEALERLMEGRTTFIIAHRLSTIRGADRIVVLQDGGIVEEGTHQELLAQETLYAHLHNIQ